MRLLGQFENFLFFYEKISHALKAHKGQKAQKALKASKANKRISEYFP